MRLINFLLSDKPYIDSGKPKVDPPKISKERFNKIKDLIEVEALRNIKLAITSYKVGDKVIMNPYSTISLNPWDSGVTMLINNYKAYVGGDALKEYEVESIDINRSYFDFNMDRIFDEEKFYDFLTDTEIIKRVTSIINSKSHVLKEFNGFYLSIKLKDCKLPNDMNYYCWVKADSNDGKQIKSFYSSEQEILSLVTSYKTSLGKLDKLDSELKKLISSYTSLCNFKLKSDDDI
jgi:hypothetical protein